MATRGNRPDPDLLRDVEELAAIGVGYDRLIVLVQTRHHERAREVYRRLHGLHPDEEIPDDVVPMPRGAAPRTIDRYLAAIRARWEKEEVEHRPQRRQELRQKTQATFLKAYAEGGPSLASAVACLRVMSKMDGLEAPQQIQVSGQLDVRAMSPFDRQKRISELWALRQRAIEEGKVIDVKPARLPPRKTGAKKKTPAKVAKKPKRAPARAKKAKK